MRPDLESAGPTCAAGGFGLLYLKILEPQLLFWRFGRIIFDSRGRFRLYFRKSSWKMAQLGRRLRPVVTLEGGRLFGY
jgi:hypothetical protein